MNKSLYLLIIALFAVICVRAADDISVVGEYTTSLGSITPDISVGGVHTTTVDGNMTPDISVMGDWTTTAAAPTGTLTECFLMVESGGMTSVASAQATVTDGTNPPGYQCYLVYATGGGILHLPLPSSASAPAQPNLAITVGLPVAISVVGLAAIIGVIFVFMRLRARRAAAAKRTWVDRPGGWATDNQMESGVVKY